VQVASETQAPNLRLFRIKFERVDKALKDRGNTADK
jgi:hypothetical protein